MDGRGARAAGIVDHDAGGRGGAGVGLGSGGRQLLRPAEPAACRPAGGRHPLAAVEVWTTARPGERVADHVPVDQRARPAGRGGGDRAGAAGRRPGERAGRRVRRRHQGPAFKCRPSNMLASFSFYEQPAVNDMLTAGYAVVVPDYEGYQPNARTTYMVGHSMGPAVIDGIRAAQ